jgi:hypothetical protein
MQLGKVFLNITFNEWSKKEKKINKLSLTKTQNLCTSKYIIKKMKPGMVADACNSSTQQAQARGT